MCRVDCRSLSATLRPARNLEITPSASPVNCELKCKRALGPAETTVGYRADENPEKQGRRSKRCSEVTMNYGAGPSCSCCLKQIYILAGLSYTLPADMGPISSFGKAPTILVWMDRVKQFVDKVFKRNVWQDASITAGGVYTPMLKLCFWNANSFGQLTGMWTDEMRLPMEAAA